MSETLEARVRRILAGVADPHTGTDLVASGALRGVGVSGSDVSVDIQLGYPALSVQGAFSDAIAGNIEGAPSGYVWLLNHATSAANGHGQVLGVVLGIALALVALSVFAPWWNAAKAGIVLAIVIAALIWVFAQGLGMPFQGMGTDPDTGPLLALIALAYWPARPSAQTAEPASPLAPEGVVA